MTAEDEEWPQGGNGGFLGFSISRSTVAIQKILGVRTKSHEDDTSIANEQEIVTLRLELMQREHRANQFYGKQGV